MSDQEISELDSLRREVAELRKIKIAFDTQNSLLKASVAATQTVTGSLMLKTVLQQALSICSQVVEAQESSLFLINGEGIVIESILARGAIIKEQKQNIIGKVLGQGLAGWVIKNRRIGLIKDTTIDERWLTLPNQPYKVHSVLCVPIFKRRTLLGIITLMHSKPEHFTRTSVELMQMFVGQMVLVLDNVRLHLETEQYSSQLSSLQAKVSDNKQDYPSHPAT
ncbi:MAG: GAF domain-containing protein, partial [Spirulinaceae cyanobacterium]